MEKKLKVILYGAGKVLKDNLNVAEKYWDIIAIADKSESLRGQKVNEYEVISPKAILDIEYDLIVIMTLRYHEEVRRNLLDMGVDFWRIVYGGRFTSNWDTNIYYADISMKKKKMINCSIKFENRSKNYDKLLYILIGYKDFLWEDVLGRIKKFCPDNIDVCLLSGGLYDERLSNYANMYGWSYLSTDVNDVTILQNYCISMFKNATLIYKMDEDVYVTENSFEKLERMYLDIVEDGEFNIGYIGPIIPLHSCAHIFLKEFNLVDEYKKFFSKKLIYCGEIASPEIRRDARYSKWFWSQGQIDDLNRKAEKKGKNFELVSFRYGICFILFSRKLYEEMGGFEVAELENHGVGWNGDEAQLMKHCSITGKMGIISLNTVCGHFDFPAHDQEMKLFRNTHKELFEIREYK